MTDWSVATVWWLLRAGLIFVFGLLIPFTTAVATVETPIYQAGQTSIEQQIAAYHTSPTTSSSQTPPIVHEREVRGRIAEARHVLMELQALIEETARAIELDNHLKIRKMENDRLRDMLSSSRAERKTSERKTDPIDDTLSTLTRTIVRNWLRSIQITYRSDKAERELMSSEKSWSDVRGRATTLRQTLIARRAELQSLRTESALLSNEVDRMRRQVTRKNAEIRLLELQQGQIAAAKETLRRNVTSKLRKALLESGL